MLLFIVPEAILQSETLQYIQCILTNSCFVNFKELMLLFIVAAVNLHAFVYKLTVGLLVLRAFVLLMIAAFSIIQLEASQYIHSHIS